MPGEILLKMVSVLTPEDMKQLKGAGYADEVKALLGYLERLAVSWRWQFGGQLDIKVWADVQVKLNRLRDALREGYRGELWLTESGYQLGW